MTKYHSDDYISFLKNIRPDNINDFSKQMHKSVFYSALSITCLFFFSVGCYYNAGSTLERIVLFLTASLNSVSYHVEALLVS